MCTDGKNRSKGNIVLHVHTNDFLLEDTIKNQDTFLKQIKTKN